MLAPFPALDTLVNSAAITRKLNPIDPAVAS
jgi:hypothetical protein